MTVAEVLEGAVVAGWGMGVEQRWMSYSPKCSYCVAPSPFAVTSRMFERSVVPNRSRSQML